MKPFPLRIDWAEKEGALFADDIAPKKDDYRLALDSPGVARSSWPSGWEWPQDSRI